MNRDQKILAETRVAFDERRPLPPRPCGPRGAAESETERRAKRMAQTHDWDRIQQKLEAEAAALQASPCNLSEENDYEGADEGEYRVSHYLGSYIISPSGKVYAPWAMSNLTPCPACKGTGRRKPRNEIERLHVADWVRLSVNGQDHMSWPGDMTPEWREHIRRVNAVTDVSEDGTLSCNECEGCHFAEAMADSIWANEMSRLAEKRDLYFNEEDGGYFIFKNFTVDAEDDGATVDKEEPRLHSESDSATTAVVLTPDGTVVSADRTTTFTTMSFKGCA